MGNLTDFTVGTSDNWPVSAQICCKVDKIIRILFFITITLLNFDISQTSLKSFTWVVSYLNIGSLLESIRNQMLMKYELIGNLWLAKDLK